MSPFQTCRLCLQRDTPAVKINLEEFPTIGVAAKEPQRQRPSHESTDGKRNSSDKRSLGNAGGRNNSIDYSGSDGELLGKAPDCTSSASGRCDDGVWPTGGLTCFEGLPGSACGVLVQAQGCS